MFQRAHTNVPNTLLFVNDYDVLLDINGRLGQYVHQIQELLASGAPVHGIGLQSHIKVTDHHPAIPLCPG